MPDKLLEEHKAHHKLPGQYNGIEDVQQHIKIRRARPSAKDVIEKARRLKGVKVDVQESGAFEVTVPAGDTRAKLELAHMHDDARRLQSERGAIVRQRQERLKARGRNGKMVEIHASNERDLVMAGALTATNTIFTAPAGIPRCQLPGNAHEIRENGRCWWCGFQVGKEARCR